MAQTASEGVEARREETRGNRDKAQNKNKTQAPTFGEGCLPVLHTHMREKNGTSCVGALSFFDLPIFVFEFLEMRALDGCEH